MLCVTAWVVIAEIVPIVTKEYCKMKCIVNEKIVAKKNSSRQYLPHHQLKEEFFFEMCIRDSALLVPAFNVSFSSTFPLQECHRRSFSSILCMHTSIECLDLFQKYNVIIFMKMLFDFYGNFSFFFYQKFYTLLIFLLLKNILQQKICVFL